MNRRDFLATSAGWTAAHALTTGADRAQTSAAGEREPSAAGEPFRLLYAPHFGMFRHHHKDPLDQLQFMYDQGFRALEDNGMKRRPVELQERIAKKMEQLGMTMGVFVAMADFRKVTFASDKAADTDAIVAQAKEAVEVAKRVNAKWCTVVPGRFALNHEMDYQNARAIENLKRAAAVFEPHGIAMVLEPLNPWRDHPGLFLSKIPHAYMLCRAVGSPSCKILFDIYHQQITEGNLIPNMRKSWDEIGYFQVGDNPGRKEPTTGEIHYKNVFAEIHRRGFKGVVGMEHGNSKPGVEGEKRVIAAYRECDPA